MGLAIVFAGAWGQTRNNFPIWPATTAASTGIGGLIVGKLFRVWPLAAEGIKMNENEVPLQDGGFVIRSLDILRQLPVEYRWEFTRRHPYYLFFWESARNFLVSPSEEQHLR